MTETNSKSVLLQSTESDAVDNLFEDDPVLALDVNPNVNYDPKPIKRYKLELVWRNIILFTFLHGAALYGAYLALTSANLWTNFWAFLLHQAAGLGVTAGAHRLWAHRAYKAKWPLRVILITFNTMAFQNHVFVWVRDHRIHHKYTETNADPHNAKRGFFFSHIGWLFCRRHPDVIEKCKEIDLTDIKNDPVVVFQKKYYLWLMLVLCFILPPLVPMYFWGESFKCAFFVTTALRHVWTINATGLVNSAAHMWGNRPYDRNINSAENKGLSLITCGEGFHNYHHVFPWDYKAAELGGYSTNMTTAFIDFFAKIGWAYDLKTVSPDAVKSRVQRTGDGSHLVWGWGDKDLDYVKEANTTNKSTKAPAEVTMLPTTGNLHSNEIRRR